MDESQKQKMKTGGFIAGAALVGLVGGYFIDPDAKKDREALEERDEKIELITAEYEQDISNNKEKISALKKDNFVLKNDVEAYKDTVETLNARVYSLSSEVKLTEDQMDQLSEKYTIIESENENLNTLLVEKEEYISELSEKNVDLSEELGLKKEQVTELETRVEAVQDENGKLYAITYTLIDDTVFPIFGKDVRAHREIKDFVENGEEINEKTKEEIGKNLEEGKKFDLTEFKLPEAKLTL